MDGGGWRYLSLEDRIELRLCFINLNAITIMITMSKGDDDIKDKLYKLSVAPFVLERQGEYQKAIDVHKSAIDVLGTAAQTFRKSGSNVRKVHRKMFERQVQLHRERLAHLEDLQRKGSFVAVVLPPSGLDVVQELAREDGDNSPWTLSQVRPVSRFVSVDLIRVDPESTSRLSQR